MSNNPTEDRPALPEDYRIIGMKPDWYIPERLDPQTGVYWQPIEQDARGGTWTAAYHTIIEDVEKRKARESEG